MPNCLIDYIIGNIQIYSEKNLKAFRSFAHRTLPRRQKKTYTRIEKTENSFLYTEKS